MTVVEEFLEKEKKIEAVKKAHPLYQETYLDKHPWQAAALSLGQDALNATKNSFKELEKINEASKQALNNNSMVQTPTGIINIPQNIQQKPQVQKIKPQVKAQQSKPQQTYVPSPAVPYGDPMAFSKAMGAGLENINPFINSIPKSIQTGVQGYFTGFGNLVGGVGDVMSLVGDIPVNTEKWLNEKTGIAKLNEKADKNIGITYDPNNHLTFSVPGKVLSDLGKNIKDYAAKKNEFWKPEDKYSDMESLLKADSALPTITQTVGSQIPNLLSMMLGAGIAQKAGATVNQARTAGALSGLVPSILQEGPYLEKIEAFEKINGRKPTTEELFKIMAASGGEKIINSVLEYIPDKMLMGKILPTGKGNLLKDIFSQALSEGLTETAQEAVSVGSEKLSNTLYPNQNIPRRLLNSGVMGAIPGGVFGGVSSAANNFSNQNIEEIAPNIVAKQEQNADKKISTNKTDKVSEEIKEIAPNIAAKQEAKKQENIEKTPQVKSEVLKEVEKIAPNTAAKIQQTEEGSNTKDFKKGDIVKDIYNNKTYEIIEPDKRGMGSIKDINTDEIETLNAHNNARFKLDENIVNKSSTETKDGKTEVNKENEQVKSTDINVEALSKERAELLNQDFIKSQRKYIEEQRQKGWEQNADNLERELNEYIKSGKNQYIGQFNTDFANAIKNKDYNILLSLLAQAKGSNDISKKIFEKYTGVKLPSTIEGKKNAILEWAGKDVEEYNNELKDRYAKKQAEREQAAKDEELKNAINELENTRVKTMSGVILTKRQFIKDLFDSGYEIEKTKQGIKPVYKLMKGNSGYKFNSRIERLYIDELYKNGANTAELDAETAAKEEEIKQKSIEKLPLKDRLIEEGFDKDDISTLLDRLNGENSLGRLNNFAKTILDRTKGKTHIEFKSLYDSYVTRRKGLMSDNESDIAKIAPNISKKQQLQEKIDKAYNLLKDNKFVPESQKQAMLDSMIESEEKEYFADKANEIQNIIDNAPEMYQTQGMNTNDIKPVLHYFGGTFDLYVTEIDKETGEMYGLGGFNDDLEWGYNTVSNFGDNPIFNLDLYYDNSKTVGEIKGETLEKEDKESYNIDKEGNDYGHNESSVLRQSGMEEKESGINEKSDRTSENRPEIGTSVSDIRRENNSELGNRRGLNPEHKSLIDKNYSNQNELNKAIEDFINNKEYEKYDELPEEIKDWLKKYTGAGGLEKQGAKGKGLLSEYYTPQNIVKKMWELTSQYINTDGSKALEPSVGIGRFLEFAPKNINFDVVEMNPISAKITELLYPNANVTVGQFQQRFIDKSLNKPVKTVTPEYDIVIGNPPYGQYSGLFKGLGEGKGIDKIETYFIKRGIDLLNENGIMTFIVPSSFLNSEMTQAKLDISKNAEILDAYRLPENTFSTTSIGTDIIVLRKTKDVTDRSNFYKNVWFKNHPEKVLGEVLERKNRFGKQEEYVKGDKNAVDTIVADKQDIKETIKQKPKETKTLTNSKTNNNTKKTKTTKNTIQETVKDFEEYKPDVIMSEDELQYFADTKVDGTLPKGKYKPGEKVNQYNGELYNDFNYLNGNIYEKLDALENEYISDEQKEIQRKKLLKVLPTPKKLSEIYLTPTSDFIKGFSVVRKVQPYGADVPVDEKQSLGKLYKNYVENLTNKERNGISVWDIRDFVDGKTVRTPYKGNPTKEEKINQRIEFLTNLKNTVDKTFNDFVITELTAEEIEKLQDDWNRNFNAEYTPDFKKMPMQIKGLSANFNGNKLKLQDVQVEGINYLSNQGVGLLGFEVGVGKTLSGTIATVQNMQLGRCKRPLILVPKSVKPNWIREVHEAFPNIKINDVDNLSKFNGEIEDGSITIATYQALDNIWYSKETEEKLKSITKSVRTDFEKEEKLTDRGREKSSEKNEEFIGKALAGNKQLHTFEELGFDHITIDEAHNFKNLFGSAKAEGQDGNPYTNISGAESTRAKRLFLATQYILDKNNNRNVFMLTATPFNNSPLEVFNMLSYLAKDKLDKMGVYNVFQFMENYVDVGADWVVDSKNEVSFKQVAKGFKNLKSLQGIIDSCMLMRSAEEAGIERPNKVVKHFSLNPTLKQKKIIAKTEALAVGIEVQDDGSIRVLDKEELKGIQLKAIAQGRIATLSPDIYENNLNVSPEDFIKNSPKLDFIMRAVEKMKKKDPSTSQLIYMPLGVDFLPKIKQYLINKGVFKANEIEIIKGGITDDKISAITDSFNDPKGDVKLIIGTNKIKEGMNLNKNSSVLYVPFIDWNPTDYVQVVGRIWRRGNKYKNIRVIVPTLNDSSDSFMYQKLDEKTSRINNIMSRGEDYIDTGELNAAEEKINMITDPDKKSRMFSQIEKQKLESKETAIKGQIDDTNYYLKEIKNAEYDINSSKEHIDRLQKTLSEIEDKESWQYRSNKNYLESYKKTLRNAEKHLESLNNRIKRLELDFNGKDSVENLTKQLEDVKKQIENLKETTELKREEYKKEYEANRKTGKGIEEYVKEFDEDTTNGNFLDLYSVYEKVKEEHTLYKFVGDLQVAEETNTFVCKAKDIINSIDEFKGQPSAQRIIDDLGDIDVCLFSQKEIDKYNGNVGAAFNGKNIRILKNTPIWSFMHELRHAYDFKRDIKNPLRWGSIINAVLANKAYAITKGTRLEKIGELWYYNCDYEKKAYKVTDDYRRGFGYGRQSRRNSSRNRFRNGETDINGKFSLFSAAEDSEQIIQNAERNGSENINETLGSNNSRQDKKRNGDRTTRGLNQADKKAKEYVRQWYAGIEKDRYDVNRTLNSFVNLTKQKAKDLSKSGVKVTDKQLREIMPFLRERTEFPDKLNRPDLKKVWDNLSKSQKADLTKLADSVSEKFEKYYKNYQGAKGVVSESEIENHISHIWDLDNKKRGLLTNYFATKSRFAKERTIETLYKGIQGLDTGNGEIITFTPKTLDYAEILKTSSDSLIKATHDMNLAETVKNMKNGKTKLVQQISKAPSDWVELNHPALNKAIYMGTVGENEIPMITKAPVKVHPDIARTLETVFETPATKNDFITGYDKLNSIFKQSQLGFSGFHMVALSESMLGNLGVKETLKILNPKRIWDEVKNGNWNIYKDDTIARQAIDDGLQLGATLDLDRKGVEQIADDVSNWVEKRIPIVGKALSFFPKTLSKVQKLNNTLLWDYLHNNYKLECYKMLCAEEGKNKTLSAADRREIAQWVNDSFGGQVWENLGIKPSGRRTEQRFLLSPDWLRSTTRQFMGMVSNKGLAEKIASKASESDFWKNAKELGERWGINSNTDDVTASSLRGKIARRFWLRSMVYSAILYNVLNAVMRAFDRKKHPELYPEKMTAKDYTLLGNSKDNKTYVFVGRNKDGSERYLRLGKQFREVPEMVENPLKKLGGKVAPNIQLASQLATGHTASGFQNRDMYKDKYPYNQMREGKDRIKASGKVIAKSFMPYSLNTLLNPDADWTALSLFAPVTKGMTKGKGRRAYEENINNEKASKEITKAMLRNNISRDDIEQTYKQARTNVRTSYKNMYIEAIETGNEQKVIAVTKKLKKKGLSNDEINYIYNKALEKIEE